MKDLPIDFGVLLAALLPLIGLTWGVRLHRNPGLYNPGSMLYRKLYFWYAAWFNREVDNSYVLEEYEIRKAARFIILICSITLFIGGVVLFL